MWPNPTNLTSSTKNTRTKNVSRKKPLPMWVPCNKITLFSSLPSKGRWSRKTVWTSRWKVWTTIGRRKRNCSNRLLKILIWSAKRRNSSFWTNPWNTSVSNPSKNKNSWLLSIGPRSKSKSSSRWTRINMWTTQNKCNFYYLRAKINNEIDKIAEEAKEFVKETKSKK